MFTIEEITLMKMYRFSKREWLIADLQEALPHIEEPDLKHIAAGVVDKLHSLSKSAFSSINFQEALDIE